MKITLKVTGKKPQKIKIKNSSTVHDILKKLDLKPDMYIANRNGEFIPLDKQLCDGDNLILLAVASGG
jgi:sulfur carrier protein ThiS